MGGAVLEFAGDDPLCLRVVETLYHAAPPCDDPPTHRYRIERTASGWIGHAPAKPLFGAARLEDVFAFLEWRATEDVLGCPSETEVYVHAAGVGAGSRTFLLAGPSGSGKSTLAAHLALGGGDGSWGDDVVRFALDSGHFSAFPRSWKLDDNALKDLDLLARLTSEGAQGTLLAASVWYVSPAAIRRQWQAPAGKPDVVVVLEPGHHGDAARVERMSEGEAALRVGRALMGTGTGSGPAWSRAMVLVLEALKDVAAWRAAGGPPAALARALVQAVAA